MSIVIIIFLFILCIAEFWFLIHDGGKVNARLKNIKSVYANKGLNVTVQMILERVFVTVIRIKSSFIKQKHEGIKIAFRPTGGLGDYIISAKVFEELLECCDCEVTVYCKNLKYGLSVYGQRNNTRVEEDKKFDIQRCSYDLALQIDHFVHVKNWDREKLLKLAPKLYEKINVICSNWNNLYISEEKQCWRERLLFERCRMLKLDRWTELRMGGAFEIVDKKVNIPLIESYLLDLERLGLKDKKYVTINYGADVMREGHLQIKVWSKEYYKQFILSLKEKCKYIEVVQLGSMDAEKIEGVDYYCLGEDLEIVKWILKYSQCHIDCEGGLVHLATQLGTRSVVIFGPTPKHMYAYPQNINLCSDKCSNCMGLHEDWAYSCMREEKGLCMKDVIPEQVVESALQVING